MEQTRAGLTFLLEQGWPLAQRQGSSPCLSTFLPSRLWITQLWSVERITPWMFPALLPTHLRGHPPNTLTSTSNSPLTHNTSKLELGLALPPKLLPTQAFPTQVNGSSIFLAALVKRTRSSWTSLPLSRCFSHVHFTKRQFTNVFLTWLFKRQIP